jgi:hypothetical protein
MPEWWSIEVMHGERSAFRWQEQHDSALIEAALTNGATDGLWHAHRWGVVFEVQFETGEQWEAFRNLPVVRAALDAVPDPVNGLLVYRGRGGGADARKPRRPKPAPSASAVSLPEPEAQPYLNLTGISPEQVDAPTAGR